MLRFAFIAVVAVVSTLSLAAAASASCRISNRTSHSFTVRSGNTSNQRVGSNTTTSIASGTIVGRSEDGASISGQCSDGDQLEVVEVDGVPVLRHR